ncbi:hypothetical protein [Nodosilinea nodulosa]|uniref:hypothetical protein n=1 Tax=Nodosilinea nodulosa TaxID=416001 RepID=UPI0002FE59C4|nr:hypothetical protein [Nodosilinea nodulosa]
MLLKLYCLTSLLTLLLLITPFLKEQAQPREGGPAGGFLMLVVLLSPITLPSLLWHRASSARHRLDRENLLLRRVARKAQTLLAGP